MADDGAAASDSERRETLLAACRKMARDGLTYGTSGNLSLRRDARSFFVTPSGAAYETLKVEEIALLDFDGHWSGTKPPSSEWRFHRDIFLSRPDVGAIVHTHSRHATALACTGRGIPAFHYMVAAAGGRDIRCAPYHTFGTQNLSNAAVAALEDRMACLLANHGVIALGIDLSSALGLAGQVENLAQQYCAALCLGQVNILDDGEMQRVALKFLTYGKPGAIDPDLIFGAEK